MRPLRDALSRARSLLFRRREAREMEEELRFHLDMETAENLRRGLPSVEARRRARVAFGGLERWTERWREARGVGALERVGRDVRLATRRLAREPSFAVPSLLTLALGIGAATAVFTLVHAVLLRPLPYPHAERLVALGHSTPGFGVDRTGMSGGTFHYYRTGSAAFEAMALYSENAVSVSVTDGERPERVRVAMVTPDFFGVMGVRPALGRAFTEDDALRPSGVVISHELWVRRYGADPSLVEGAIELNRNLHPVVGVMPPAFDFPHRLTDVWYATTAPRGRAALRDMYKEGVGRLRAGVAPAEAEADLTRLVPGLADAFPDVTPDLLRDGAVLPTVTPLRATIVEGVRPALLLLLCTGAFVLAITLANVAALFLVRAERQRREVAVARALGAGGADVARRFLAESLLLAIPGGALGAAAAYAGVAARFGFEPGELPRIHEMDFGVGALGFAALLSLAAALLVAAVSLARARRLDSVCALAGAASRVTAGPEWQRVHRTLGALQLALSLALLVGSALMVRSVWKLARADLGFQPAGVLTFDLNPPASRYLSYEHAAALHRELGESLRALPGVVAVEVASSLPLAELPAYFLAPVRAVDGETRSGTPPQAALSLASPGYFRAMGIEVRRGRGFAEAPASPDAPPVIVSAGLARSLFGDADPVGRRVRLGAWAERYPPYVVIGVVDDVPGETLIDGPEATLYMPAILRAGADSALTGAYVLVPREMTVVVKTTLPPLAFVSSVRAAVRAIDPKLPVADVRTMEQRVGGATARTRLIALLLGLAAGAALFLGTVGVYGIVSYAVGQRTAEIGVRVALGARPVDVERLVFGNIRGMALGGVAGGLLAAFLLSRLLRGLLFGVGASEPAAYLAMTALLLLVVIVATWIPARRAGRFDPAAALRAD